MIIKDEKIVHSWIIKKLNSFGCQADVEVLSRYIIALLTPEEEKSLQELKEICLEELFVFLEKETEKLVEALFAYLTEISKNEESKDKKIKEKIHEDYNKKELKSDSQNKEVNLNKTANFKTVQSNDRNANHSFLLMKSHVMSQLKKDQINPMKRKFDNYSENNSSKTNSIKKRLTNESESSNKTELNVIPQIPSSLASRLSPVASNPTFERTFSSKTNGKSIPSKKSVFSYFSIEILERQSNQEKVKRQQNVLEISNIPPNLNNIENIMRHFNKFGTIVKIDVNHRGNPKVAQVQFQNSSNARAAFSSKEAILGNRFIKIYFAPVLIDESFNDKHPTEECPGINRKVNNFDSIIQEKTKLLENYNLTEVQRQIIRNEIDKLKVSQEENCNKMTEKKLNKEDLLKTKKQLFNETLKYQESLFLELKKPNLTILKKKKIMETLSQLQEASNSIQLIKSVQSKEKRMTFNEIEKLRLDRQLDLISQERSSSLNDKSTEKDANRKDQLLSTEKENNEITKNYYFDDTELTLELNDEDDDE